MGTLSLITLPSFLLDMSTHYLGGKLEAIGQPVGLSKVYFHVMLLNQNILQ